MEDNHAHPYNRRRMLTIDDLPDDGLLEIFDFHVPVVKYQDLGFFDFSDSDYNTKRKKESWQSLVHVCRRWRGLVFGSPRRLNLQLVCIVSGTFARKSLDVWPALPLHILGCVSKTSVDNFITVLENSDRICQIQLICNGKSPEIEKLWTAMQVSFPELAILHLARFANGPDLPDSFLGRSAPRLRYLHLTSISFPGLPKLLLSATHLVQLHLQRIGYISPEAMATGLTMMTSLETLRLEFEISQLYPDLKGRRSPRPTRFILPALTGFWFQGANEYLEGFVAWIDSPRLRKFVTTFFDIIDFNTPELNQLISRTPTLGAYNQAHLAFCRGESLVWLRQSHPEQSDPKRAIVSILSGASDRRVLSNLAKICTLSLRPLLTMENLYIYGNGRYPPLIRKNDIEMTEWLNLLLLFTTVKNLYLSKRLSLRVAPVMQELSGGSTTEVLPALQNILLQGFQPSEPVQEGIAQFISARQLTNRPVAISVWDCDLWDEP